VDDEWLHSDLMFSFDFILVDRNCDDPGRSINVLIVVIDHAFAALSIVAGQEHLSDSLRGAGHFDRFAVVALDCEEDFLLLLDFETLALPE